MCFGPRHVALVDLVATSHPHYRVSRVLPTVLGDDATPSGGIIDRRHQDEALRRSNLFGAEFHVWRKAVREETFTNSESDLEKSSVLPISVTNQVPILVSTTNMNIRCQTMEALICPSNDK